MISNHDIIELKTNHIPKIFVPLARLFNNNDVFINPSTKSSREYTLDCNFGIDSELEFVKVSKALSDDHKKKYIDMMK